MTQPTPAIARGFGAWLANRADTAQSAHSIVAGVAAPVGGLLFLLGTVLHPARDGHGIAAVGELYGITHSIQAIGLALLAVALAGLLAQAWRASAPTMGWYSALIGTLAWLALIIYDGSHNPVTARYAPELVHTAADLDAGGAMLVLPALILFPLGYALLGLALVRRSRVLPGLLVGAGAVIYTIGGLLIFAIEPSSPAIQAVEVAGAIPFALGFVLLARPAR